MIEPVPKKKINLRPRAFTKTSAPPKKNVVEEEDELDTDVEETGKNFLSVVKQVLEDPKVNRKIVTSFKERLRPSQAVNLMAWLLSMGDLKDEGLEEVLEGGLKFPCLSSGFYPYY